MYLNAQTPRSFGDWTDVFTGYDSGQLKKESADLDAQLAALNEQARAKGTITEATYQQMVSNLAIQIQQTNDVPPNVDEGWVEQAASNLSSAFHATIDLIASMPELYGRVYGDIARKLGTGIGKGVSAAASGAAKGIMSATGGVPLWLWAVGALALFVYLGGGKVVEFQARKRIARYAR